MQTSGATHHIGWADLSFSREASCWSCSGSPELGLWVLDRRPWRRSGGGRCPVRGWGLRRRGESGWWGRNGRSGGTGGWGRAVGSRGWGCVDRSGRWGAGVVGVVQGILGWLTVLHSGEVDTASRVSWLWPHHRHSVISFSQQNPQGIEFSLDGRVPLPRRGRPAHVVVEVSGFWELIFLLWHLDSCILCLF